VEGRGCGVVLGDLDHEQAIRIGAGARELRIGATRMQREAAPALLIRRGGDGGHDPRTLLLEQRGEAAKVRRDEADVAALVAQGTLERTPEAGEDVDVGVLVGVRPGEHQSAADSQVLPVVALAERRQQGRGLAGAKRKPERVGGPQLRGRVGGGEALGRHRPRTYLAATSRARRVALGWREELVASAFAPAQGARKPASMISR